MHSYKNQDAQTTYRQLRIAMPVLVIMLATAVIYQILRPDPDCWLGSISAYYYTSARAVFVASLCAIGACLVAYRGNTPSEDLALNVSGFLAFVVAFIPTPRKDLVVPIGVPRCGNSNKPTSEQLVAAVDNNIFAFLVACAVAAVVVIVFYMRTIDSKDGKPSLLSTLVLALSVGGSWIWFITSPESLRQRGHLLAAVLLVVGIVAVMVMYAFELRFLGARTMKSKPPFRTLYRGLVLLMVAGVTVIGLLALLSKFEHTVFWLEAMVLVLFGAFWVVQTCEFWDLPDRRDPVDGDRRIAEADDALQGT